jgi:hypothetical protein
VTCPDTPLLITYALLFEKVLLLPIKVILPIEVIGTIAGFYSLLLVLDMLACYIYGYTETRKHLLI